VLRDLLQVDFHTRYLFASRRIRDTSNLSIVATF
jgi:hypothetical protein